MNIRAIHPTPVQQFSKTGISLYLSLLKPLLLLTSCPPMTHQKVLNITFSKRSAVQHF